MSSPAPFHEKPHHPHWPLSALLFAFVFFIASRSVHETSTYIHLKVGALIAANGAVPRVEPFSYGAEGARWTTHSWLSDLIFARLDQLGGPSLLIGVKAALIASGFALFLPINGGNPAAAAALLAAGAASAWAGFAETAAIFDFILFASLVRLLRPRGRFRPEIAAGAVALTVLWANLHGGSAVIALWLVGLKAFKTSMRSPARERMAFGAMALACLIAYSWNPHGFGLFEHCFVDAGSGWSAWRESLLSPGGVFIACGAFACAVTLQQEFVATLACATILLLSAALPGLRPLAVMAACPMIALALGHATKPRVESWRRIAQWAVFAALVGFAYDRVVTLPLAPARGYSVPALSGVARFLSSSGARGRLFNEPATGDELIGLTNRTVFSDSRLWLYPDQFRREARQWASMFRQLDEVYRFDMAIVLNRRALHPAGAIEDAPGWRLAYADDRALVYAKSGGASDRLVSGSPLGALSPNRLWPDFLDARLKGPDKGAVVLAELDRWSVIAPDAVQPLLWKAYVLRQLGENAKSNALLDVAKERPVLNWNPELQAIHARVLEAAGRTSEAAAEYRNAARSAGRLGDLALAAAISERLNPPFAEAPSAR